MDTNIPKIKPEWLVGITMTSEQKAKWLSALRSGEYQQAHGRLKNGNGYCCLGVYARAVMGLESINGNYLYHYGGPFCSPNDTDHEIEDALAGMNDSGVSFDEIADFIEASIPACDEARS